MYELIKISENDYYIDCPSKIGIVKINNSEVFAIDSGNDKDAGKKVLRRIEENGWKLKAVINTHSHADHIGGNAYLQGKTGCKIYTKETECAFARHPVFEPAFLFGAFPFEDIKNKFFMAQESVVLPIEDLELPEGFEIIDLPGHTFDMIGIKTPDGNFFAADSIASCNTLKKYQITYLYDVKEYLNTLKKLKTLDVKMFIPSHTEVFEKPDELVDLNILEVREITNNILDILSGPKSYDELMQQIFFRYGIKPSAMQYILIGCTIRSYLSYLLKEEKIEFTFEDSIMKWVKKEI